MRHFVHKQHNGEQYYDGSPPGSGQHRGLEE
jgi:hypothetical protein